MAEISRIQHVVPAPSVAHDPHRIHRPEDRPGRDAKHHSSPKDEFELHEDDELEEEAAPAPTNPFGEKAESPHIDIAI